MDKLSECPFCKKPPTSQREPGFKWVVRCANVDCPTICRTEALISGLGSFEEQDEEARVVAERYWNRRADAQKPGVVLSDLGALKLQIYRHHLLASGWTEEALAEEEAECVAEGREMSYGYQYAGESAVDEALEYLVTRGLLSVCEPATVTDDLDEYAWLIEHVASEISAPEYWGGYNMDATPRWVSDHQKAFRFIRKREAEQAVDLWPSLCFQGHRIAEHAWMHTPTGLFRHERQLPTAGNTAPKTSECTVCGKEIPYRFSVGLRLCKAHSGSGLV